MPESRELSLKTFLLAISSVVVMWLPVLLLHLVIMLFAALTAYACTRAISRLLRGVSKHHVGWAVFLVIFAFVLLALMLASWVENRADGFSAGQLMSSVADILDQLRTRLPPAIATHIPDGVSSLQAHASEWLKLHAKDLQTMGLHTLRGAGHLLIGAAVGAIAAFQTLPLSQASSRSLPMLLREHFQELLMGFTNVFFAQMRISLINTALTAVYLLVILPLVGKPLPLAGTMVVFTFVAGLIPVVGNLMSNSLILVMSFGDSLGVAVASLLFLVAIHKLEYFLNAEIIGQKINARAWELLVAMVFMEAAFGIPGLVSAPVIYAQTKQLLALRGWV